jgi:hypothetical protein
VLRKELQDRLERKGWSLEWADVLRDLDRPQEVELSIGGKSYVMRTETKGYCGHPLAVSPFRRRSVPRTQSRSAKACHYALAKPASSHLTVTYNFLR